MTAKMCMIMVLGVVLCACTTTTTTNPDGSTVKTVVPDAAYITELENALQAGGQDAATWYQATHTPESKTQTK